MTPIIRMQIESTIINITGTVDENKYQYRWDFIISVQLTVDIKLVVTLMQMI